MTISLRQPSSSHLFKIPSSAESVSNAAPVMQGNLFASALTAAIGKVEKERDGQDYHASLTKGEIATLILKIQKQVDDLLLHLLIGGDNGNDKEKFLSGVPRPFGIIAKNRVSNNGPFDQKNDAIPPPGEVDAIIERAAKINGVEDNLIRSVIKVESNFKIHSKSPKGAMGLMQLMPDTARELGVKNAYDPVENIMGGTKYLKGLLDRYGGDMRVALAAYNWGMGNVEKNPQRLPKETREYVSRVISYFRGAKV